MPGGHTAPVRATAAPAPVGDDEASAAITNVGIVFVHGIGTQPACETLLGWSAPIIEVLSTWCHDHDAPIDPVRRADYDLSGQTLPFIELTIPEWEEHESQRWVLTEAWWSSVTIAPKLPSVTDYLFRALPKISSAIAESYEGRAAKWRKARAAHEAIASRTLTALGDEADPAVAVREAGRDTQAPKIAAAVSASVAREVAAASPGPPSASAASGGDADQDAGSALSVRERVRENAQLVVDSTDRRWGWIDWLDAQQKGWTRLALVPGVLLGGVVLKAYALVRLIPIKKLQEAAALKSIDTYLTRWFGELPDILDDPVQAAEVRLRLMNAIRGVHERGCDRIVVVAHSGGAIVSWTTLVDPVFSRERVDKLITLGEGLQLGWRIQDAYRTRLPTWSKLTGDLRKSRPMLRWADFWGTYDPAPAGPLRPPKEVVELPVHTKSTATLNRMSILEDHGTYWQNDEGFVMPLLRHLDTPCGEPEESRFYRDPQLDLVRLERRRQRVGVLALWRWIPTLLAFFAVLTGTVVAVLGLDWGPNRITSDVARGLSKLLGVGDLIGGPVNWLADIAKWPEALRMVGEWAFGVAVIAALFFLLYRVGVSQWEKWDSVERAESRRRELHEVERRRPAIVFTLLAAFSLLLFAAVLAWMFVGVA